jgi:putative PIG3 family NAD(P)H quinone oxidoreductase
MKAVVVDTSSTPPRLRVVEVDRPTPGPGEVVIDVHSAGVNRADLLQVRGQYPSPPDWPQWPGLEVAGTVAQCGQGVTDVSPGDRVCALVGGGGYAEAIAVPAELVLPVPDGLDVIEAGGLVEAACTAWSNIAPHMPRHGGTLLVHGGSGGVGSIAIQIGRALGMRVFTTARGPERTARCREELGAELAIDYTAEDFAPIVAAEGGADIILDVVGADYLSQNLTALAPHGTIAIIGRQSGSHARLDLASLMGGWATVTGTLLRARPHHERAAIIADVWRDVWPLVPSHVKPVIHGVMPFEQAHEAHEALRSGEVFGKIVLTPTRHAAQ